MKRMMAMVLLALFAGCAAVVWMGVGSGAAFGAESEQIVAQVLRQPGEDDLALQRDLVKWYNLNLKLAWKDSGFREAYWNILDLGEQSFGVLSVPSLGLKIPIYHGTQREDGAGHIPSTPFPVGGDGEHSALTVPVLLEEGTYFYIHILRQVLAYRVTRRLTGADYSPEEGASLCTLVYRQGTGEILLRGELDASAPAEQEIQIQPQEDSDGWLVAAWVVLALGMLLVPFLVWCRGG